MAEPSSPLVFDSSKLKVCVVDTKDMPGLQHLLPDGADTSKIDIVTWLPLDWLQQYGIPAMGHVGMLPHQSPLNAESFQQNRGFINHLHQLNRERPDPALIDFVAQGSDPYVAVIDQRCPDVNGEVLSEDVLGFYSVKEGKIDGYEENSHYRLIVERGRFCLNPWLRRVVAEEMLKSLTAE